MSVCVLIRVHVHVGLAVLAFLCFVLGQSVVVERQYVGPRLQMEPPLSTTVEEKGFPPLYPLPG